MTKIIAIDDSRTVRMFVKMTLGQVGYDVETSDELFDFAPDDDPPADLVLIDVNMNEFLGTDLVAHIRQNWPGPPLIYLYSELPEEQLADEVRTCGADGYISKRWGYEGLVDEVQRALEARDEHTG